jgi:hypothetical protein
MADTRLRAKDPVDAQRWIDAAFALQRRDDGTVPRTMRSALAKSLKGISLLQFGKTADALESLLAAQDELSKLIGADHPTTSLYSLNVAIALEALGRTKDALVVVEHAEPLLRKSMGVDAPTYLRVKQLQNRLQQIALIEVPVRPGSSPRESGVNADNHLSTDFYS